MIQTFFNQISSIHNQDVFIHALTFLILFILTVFFFAHKISKKNQEIKDFQKQHASKIDRIRKEHAQTLENIRNEMLKKEEHRITQWAESEKEILHALNGITYLFEIKEKIDKKEIDIYTNKMEEIINLIKKYHEDGEN